MCFFLVVLFLELQGPESLLIASSNCKSVLIEGCFQYYCLMVWRYGNRSGVRARLSCELVELGSSAAPTRPWDGPTQRDKKTPLGHRSCCARVADPDARNTITTSNCNVTSITYQIMIYYMSYSTTIIATGFLVFLNFWYQRRVWNYWSNLVTV